MPFVPPVDTLNRGHPTLWGNLGDWSRASSYVEAARALAEQLGRAAGLLPDHTVVDLGCGAGDQLRLWVETFGVRHVTGVERDRRLSERARRRVAEWGLDGRVTVVTGRAADDSPDGPTDRVLALDSAYFFDCRAAFLSRCRRILRPDGVLALTDLVLGEGHAAQVARSVAPLFGVRRGNLLTEARYRATLGERGFDRIEIRDLTEPVLGGFAKWTRAGGHREGRDPPWSDRVGLAATGRAAELLAGSGGLRYVLITARRKAR
jgi:SAM-dependent methyltransferase